MLDCPSELTFSSAHSKKRRAAAAGVMGLDVVDRLIAFALFLLGARREEVSAYVGIPLGTLFSFLTRMSDLGLAALQDRRTTESSPHAAHVDVQGSPRCSVRSDDQWTHVSVGPWDSLLKVPLENLLQRKTVLVTFLENGLLTTTEVAGAVGLSARRVRDLQAGLREQDVAALMDKRVGQQTDYRFSPAAKAELVQQFAVNAISGQPTSSRALEKGIEDRCGLRLPDRSIRVHVRKLGLNRIADTLPSLIAALKKTPDDESGAGQ
jgi:hypothetical protein